MLLYSVASAALLACGVVLYKRRRRRRRRVAFDIEHATRIVESSTTAALQRMRQANEKLEKAQRATHNKEAQLAEALGEYNRCVAELVDYLNVASRHHSRANKNKGG
jgi:hypothetical protein